MQQFRGFQGIGRLACIGLMLAVSACSRSDPEQALRGEFALLQQAIEQRQAGAVAGFLAPDFIGNDGLDRDGARRLAAGMFLRHRSIGVTTGPLQLQLRGSSSATVAFDATVTGGSGGLLPEQGQWYRIETGWRVDDGQWRMVSARWAPR